MQFQYFINTPAAGAPDTTPELLASLRRPGFRYRSPAPRLRRPSTKLNVALVPSAAVAPELPVAILTRKRAARVLAERPFRVYATYSDLYFIPNPDIWTILVLHRRHPIPLPPPPRIIRRLDVDLIPVPAAAPEFPVHLLRHTVRPTLRTQRPRKFFTVIETGFIPNPDIWTITVQHRRIPPFVSAQPRRPSTKLPVELIPSLAAAPTFPDALIQTLRRPRVQPAPPPVLRYVSDLIKTNVFQDASPTIEVIITMHRIKRWKLLPVLPPFTRQKRFVAVDGELNAETIVTLHRIKIIKRWFLPVGRQQQKLHVSLIPSATSSVDAELLLTQNKKPRRWWRPVSRQMTKLPVELIPSAPSSVDATALIVQHRRIPAFVTAQPRRPSSKLNDALIPSATSSVDAELLTTLFEPRRRQEMVHRKGTRLNVTLLEAPAAEPEFPVAILRRKRRPAPAARIQRTIVTMGFVPDVFPDSILLHRRTKPFVDAEARRPSTKLNVALIPSALVTGMPDAILAAHRRKKPFVDDEPRRPSTKLPVVLVPSATSSVDAELLAVQYRIVRRWWRLVGRQIAKLPVVLIPSPISSVDAELLAVQSRRIPPFIEDEPRRPSTKLPVVLVPAPPGSVTPDAILTRHVPPRRIAPVTHRKIPKLLVVLIPSAPPAPIPEAVLVAHKAPRRLHKPVGRKQPINWFPTFPHPLISYGEQGSLFLFEWKNWARTVWYHEVYMRATTGAVQARIVDDGGTSIGLSELGTSSGVFIRIRSVGFSLVDGTEYQAQFGTVPGDGGEVISSKLIGIESLVDNPNRSVAFPREHHIQLVLENAITI